MEASAYYRPPAVHASSHGDYGGEPDDRRYGGASMQSQSHAMPLLDLAFDGGGTHRGPTSSRSPREHSEHRSSRYWDRASENYQAPSTARVDNSGGGREQALMRATMSWHAGNGSAASRVGGEDYGYDDVSVMGTQDESVEMEETDPALFHAGVVEHAQRLGIDPETESEFLWIARDSLIAPLPDGWYHVTATETGEPYYYNELTGESRWDHPLDDHFRNMYRSAKEDKVRGGSAKRYDTDYRDASTASSYYKSNAGGEYHTSAWGEQQQSNGQTQSGYDSTQWSGEYYAGYDSSSYTHAGVVTSTPSTSDAYRDDMNARGVSVGKGVDGSESPHGGVVVRPYDPSKTVSSEQHHTDKAKSGEMLQLQAQITELKTQLAERDKAWQVKETETLQLRETLKDYSQKLDAGSKERDDMVASHEAVEKELARARSRLELGSKTAEDDSTQLLQDELADERRTRMELESRLEKMIEDQTNREQTAKGIEDDQVEEMRQKLEQEQNTRTSLESQLEQAQEEQERMQTKLSDFQAQVRQLEQDLVGQQNSSQEAGAKAAEQDAVRFSSLRAEIAEKDRDVSAMSSQVETMRQELAQSKSAHSKALESLKDMESQVLSKTDELEARHQEVSTLQKSLQGAQSELAALKEQIEDATGKHAAQLGEAEDKQRALKREVRSLERDVKSLQTTVKEKEQEVVQMKQRCESVEIKLSEQIAAVETARQQGYQDAERANAEIVRQYQEEKTRVGELYKQEMLTRRKLHNQLMELQGNIRVFCRVRPIQPVEQNNDQCAPAVFFRDNDHESLDLMLDASGDKSNAIGQKYAFEFDHVFQPTSTQDQVFEQTKALVVSALDGYNVCIFAYGQTGSGKTHTMEGPPHDRGVNFRALRELFAIRDERMESGSFECSMKLSILEVYNETIVDLLDSGSGSSSTAPPNTPSAKGLDVRAGKSGVYVDNLIEVEVNNENDVLDLMKLGHSHRSVGAHDFNEHSSRSHLVLSISIEAGTSKTDSQQRRRASKLHLIDLAGSERVSKTAASGQRLKEAQFINRSLSALGDVIAALGGNSKHVPYRNSKLTFLLQDSLSGNSKVLMFVNVSPVLWNAAETLCSLNFAARCRSVALGQAKPNASTPSAASSPASSVNGGAPSSPAPRSTNSMAGSSNSPPQRAAAPAPAVRSTPTSVTKSVMQPRQAQ